MNTLPINYNITGNFSRLAGQKDVVKDIFSYLHPREITKVLPLTCKFFYCIIHHPNFIGMFLNNVSAREADISGRRFVQLAVELGEERNRLKKVDLSDCHLNQEQIRDLVRTNPQITHLNLRNIGYNLSSSDTAFIVEHLHNLECLKFTEKGWLGNRLRLYHLKSALNLHPHAGHKLVSFERNNDVFHLSEGLTMREFISTFEFLELGIIDEQDLENPESNLVKTLKSIQRLQKGNESTPFYTSIYSQNLTHLNAGRADRINEIADSLYPNSITSVRLIRSENEGVATSLVPIATKPKFQNIKHLSLLDNTPNSNFIHIITHTPCRFDALQSLTIKINVWNETWRLLVAQDSPNQLKQLKYLKLQSSKIPVELVSILSTQDFVLPKLETFKLINLRGDGETNRPNYNSIWDMEVRQLSLNRQHLKVYDSPDCLMKIRLSSYYKEGIHYVHENEAEFDKAEKDSYFQEKTALEKTAQNVFSVACFIFVLFYGNTSNIAKLISIFAIHLTAKYIKGSRSKEINALKRNIRFLGAQL